jgi:hypothetical protein
MSYDYDKAPTAPHHGGKLTAEQATPEIERLRAALWEISKGEGAFSRDQLTHAKNCIESMRQIAYDALGAEQDATQR